ncbi:zinc knuckle CX2CX4HX4C containing protein [Tanacetum coccineum]
MEVRNGLNKRERTAGIQGIGASGASCNGNPKASIYSPLVSRSTPFNMPRGVFNVDVAATFRVSLTTLGDLDVLTKDIEAGKHEELLFGMTNDKRIVVMDALVAMCDSIRAENTNADATPCMVSHVDDSITKGASIVDDNLSSKVLPNDPIVKSIDIHEKPSSYVSAAGGSKPEPSKSKANFRLLFSENSCEGVNVFIPSNAVEMVSTRFANTLYGYFIGFSFFQFKTAKGLEDVLENGPWMIRFLGRWLSIIASNIGKPILLDSYTSSMCIESYGRSSFARCLIEINAKDVLLESLTIGVPLIENTGITIETITIEYEWKPPRCDLCKIFGHIHDHCPKKVLISPIVANSNVVTPTAATSNVVAPTVEKTNDGFQTMGKKEEEGYEPKATTSAPKKKTTNVGNAKSMLNTTITSTKKGNIATSNPYFALEDESDEDVENVYDESDNLFQSTKTDKSSSFTAAVG